MPKLFSPLNFGAIDLSHRIVMPGLVQLPYARNEGRPTAGAYAQITTVGGLIIGEPSPISMQGTGHIGSGGLYDRPQVQEWRHITDAVHARKGVIIAQLCHVGRLAHSSINGDGPVSASDRPCRSMVWSAAGNLVPAETPRPLDQRGIDAVIGDYRQAALNAREAGFDAVELNSADGYLPDQFLQDLTNTRTDRYGGMTENRILFLSEVVQALIDVWGRERVGVRLSPCGSYNDIADSDPVELFTAALRQLWEHDIAYVHLVRSRADGTICGHEPFAMPQAAERFRAAFPGIMIVSGNYTRDSAVEAVESRWADAVGFGGGPVSIASASETVPVHQAMHLPP